jgi:deoxyribodipyrimidine photo-lyase
MRALVWFRSDLRVHDQRALYYACREATDGVAGVYTVCPGQWSEHDWADVRVDFVLRNLVELERALHRLRIALRIVACDRFSRVPAELLRLAKSLGCDRLYFNREYEVNELRRDDAVGRTFEKAGRQVRIFDDQVILPPGSVLTRAGRPFSVFTPFRRAWLGALPEHDRAAPLPSPRRRAAAVCASDPVPSRVRGFDRAGDQPDLWPAGERAASNRLRDFITRRLDAYHLRRDFPALDGTSRLSPYLTSGVISPRVCLHAALEVRGAGVLDSRSKASDGPTTWTNELIWRDFYKHVLLAWPRLSMHRAFRPEMENVKWREDESDFEAWCAGRTGYPLIDAAMRQLGQTGWMHNRLRMLVAMFLSKHLLIDWRRGERFFMRRLVDGDLAANNGGWQWSASTGADAVPYFRIFNPIAQSRRFDPDGEFIRRFVPELSDTPTQALHDPARLSAGRPADYPRPICNHAQSRRRALRAFAAAAKTRRPQRRLTNRRGY